MIKVTLFLKRIRDLFFGNIKPVSIKGQFNKEQLIFRSDKFCMPQHLDIFNTKHANFGEYEIEMPAFYVRSYSNAWCFTNREEILNANKEVIVEYTSQKKNPLIGASKVLFARKKRKITGVAAHLSLSGLENNYYHFLTECLARFYLLEQSNFKPDFYIISNHLRFQKEILNLLGIRADRIIPTNSNLLLEVETLIVPDLINNWTAINYRGVDHYQKQWQPSWTINLYRDNIALIKSKNSTGRKIYVSRDKAAHRKFVNHAAVNQLFFETGFEAYYLEEMSIAQQIELFSSAAFVAGIHGAGFSNLYFANPGIKFLEIYSAHYLDASYRVLSTAAGINYMYLIGETPSVENIHPLTEDVYIDIGKLKDALTKLLADK